VKDKILSNGGDLGYCSNAHVYGRRTPPQQEPVATLFGSLPVYDTAPPDAQRPWVGLTDDEFRYFASTFDYGTGGLIRAIEAKLKEKNT
jgi:hypothetical protein